MRYSRRKGSFSVNCDPKLLNLDFIHGFLTNTHWAKGRSRETVEKSIQNSLCFGLYDGEKQIGFARIVTDYTVLAYVFDVFVDERYRGQGHGKWLMETVLEHPELMSLKWVLRASNEAIRLYQKVGFQHVEGPGLMMEKKLVPASPSINWD